MSNNNDHRVIVIGLDGATFDIIKPLVRQGRLPHVARLMERGAHGNLISTLPPITPTAWTTFMTGVNPGKHGLFDFLTIRPGTYDFTPVPANQHGCQTLWRLLSEAGKTVIALDVPFTYPPEPLNGYMITGYGTPRGEDIIFTYPPKLRQELTEQCGDCEVASYPTEHSLRSKYFRWWNDILDNRDAIAAYLLNKVEWDLFMIVYGGTDNLQHALWHFLDPLQPAYHTATGSMYREKLFGYYQRVDQSIGRLLAQTGEDVYVIIMSDHGFGSTRTGQYLTKLLMDEGLLHFRSPRMLAGLGEKAVKRTLEMYHAVPLLSRIVRRLGPRQKLGLRRTMEQLALLPTAENTDWTRTRAFPGGYGLQIYINEKGRYPQGIVEPGDQCETLQVEISEHLLARRDPGTGRPIVKAVHLRQDIYHGPAAQAAPDLLIEYTNFYDPENDHGPAPEATYASLEGNHTLEGVLIAYGPAIACGPLREAQIADLTPTILYLMGLPVPSNMDGHVLIDILDPAILQDQPITYSAAGESIVSDYEYSEVEMEQVKAQLRALGYIE